MMQAQGPGSAPCLPAARGARRSVFLALALALALAVPASGGPPLRPAPPDWAKDAVWYQVFPERFRNGDPGNDPAVPDLAGAWPHDPVKAWQVSPWTSDWYALQPWEKANGRGFYHNAQLRRYGGDLQGVLDSLDYLQELGVTAVYLNPVFESPSLHKYDATCYHHVDDNFGPDPAGDRALRAKEDPADPRTWAWTSADRLLLRLVAECHRRGMRLVLDGVFNHVGQTFWAFRHVREHGAASPYAGWFVIRSFDDPKTPQDEFAYEGWAGVPELPELRDEGDTLAAGPREHIRAVVRRWGDPDGDGDPRDGIDGWRLDVAEKVGHGFWREFRGWVRDVNPEAYVAGEVWWEDWPANRMYDPEPWLRGDQFDAVMNYRFADAVKAFALDRRQAVPPSELDRRLRAAREGLRPETALVLMNLLDSHDTDRVGSQAVNPDRLYDHAITPREDPSYEVRAPRAEEWRRVRLAVALQMTAVGAPMVYYGAEAGMWGADDPDERKPMVWRHLRYEAEAADPLGRPRLADPVAFDEGLFAHYRSLTRLRREHAALRRGGARTLLADDAARVYAFARELGEDRVVVVLNGAEEERAVSLPGDLRFPVDALGAARVEAAGEGTRVTLPALAAAVLVPGGPPPGR